MFQTGLAPDGHTTTVGVVGDLQAARVYINAHYPGTIVHGNTP
ncbi:hypothetical protein [Kitasatospora sp. NPDC017646]